MYVIVEILGQQFKAEAGKKLFVHHFETEANATVEFDKVLLVDKDGAITVGVPTVEGAKVVCEVKSPLVKGCLLYTSTFLAPVFLPRIRLGKMPENALKW